MFRPLKGLLRRLSLQERPFRIAFFSNHSSTLLESGVFSKESLTAPKVECEEILRALTICENLLANSNSTSSMMEKIGLSLWLGQILGFCWTESIRALNQSLWSKLDSSSLITPNPNNIRNILNAHDDEGTWSYPFFRHVLLTIWPPVQRQIRLPLTIFMGKLAVPNLSYDLCLIWTCKFENDLAPNHCQRISQWKCS